MPLPWVEAPFVDIDFGLPQKRRFDAVPRDILQKGEILLRALGREAALAGVDSSRMRQAAVALDLRTMRRFHAEAVALARTVGVSWQQVLAANLAYEIAVNPFGCSTVMMATDRGPVLARNMDWFPQDVLARCSVLIRFRKRNRLVFANAGWPGSIGAVSGLSGRGFGVVVNFVHAPEGVDYLGYPVLLMIRRVLEDADGFEQAVTLLSGTRLAAGALFSVVGTENHERVVIERTTRRHSVRTPRNGEPLVTTNHFRSMSANEADLDDRACPRWTNLRTAADDMAELGTVTDERLLYELSEPGVMQEITAQHVIIRPRDESISLHVPRYLLDAETSE